MSDTPRADEWRANMAPYGVKYAGAFTNEVVPAVVSRLLELELNAMRELLVEARGELDRMGQEGLRARIDKALRGAK